MTQHFQFKFEWEGLDALKNEFKTMDKRFRKIMLEELDKVAQECLGYTVDLAPQDTGHLEGSLNTNGAKIHYDKFIVDIGTNVEYAMMAHEMQGRGPKTLAKGSVGGYLAGPKFMTNAVKLTEKHYNQAMERALSRVLGGRV